MAVSQDMPNARAGVSFALDRIEQRDGQIVVVGSWSGVRGMRFVRPALLVATSRCSRRSSTSRGRRAPIGG